MTSAAPPISTAWCLDPQDPRAPSMEVWDAMSPEERAAVIAALEAFEDGRVRFFTDGAPLPFQQELIGKLEHAVDTQLSRVTELETALEDERKAREDERKALEDERKAREEAERALAEALAELKRLRGE